MERVRVTVSPEEYTALARLCEEDLRSPSDQIHHLLRAELQRRGLLPSPPHISTESGVLTQRQRLVMCAFWSARPSKQPTLEEVGRRLGITRERVRMTQRDAIRALWDDYRARL
jgi:DNA-directed RNA polymerase sigma subunit (sigma70/sigma32)